MEIPFPFSHQTFSLSPNALSPKLSLIASDLFRVQQGANIIKIMVKRDKNLWLVQKLKFLVLYYYVVLMMVVED